MMHCARMKLTSERNHGYSKSMININNDDTAKSTKNAFQGYKKMLYYYQPNVCKSSLFFF